MKHFFTYRPQPGALLYVVEHHEPAPPYLAVYPSLGCEEGVVGKVRVLVGGEERSRSYSIYSADPVSAWKNFKAKAEVGVQERIQELAQAQGNLADAQAALALANSYIPAEESKT